MTLTEIKTAIGYTPETTFSFKQSKNGDGTPNMEYVSWKDFQRGDNVSVKITDFKQINADKERNDLNVFTKNYVNKDTGEEVRLHTVYIEDDIIESW